MSFNPTPEQSAIVSFVRDNPTKSLIVSALAGAAKTSTLVLMAHAMPIEPVICCAFNKKIADEMAKRLPGHFTCKTMNALGNTAWKERIGRWSKVEPDKMYDLVKQESERDKSQREWWAESFASLLRGLRSAKSTGYVPPDMRTVAPSLVSTENFIESAGASSDVNFDAQFMNALDRILSISIAQAYEGRIDFDDQIYMSTLFGGKYFKYPTVMVDEAQDLSPLNHETLRQIVGKRLIAVGDPNQAIYGFRGAHTSSMSVLRQQFNCDELHLTVSFRCPRAVVALAQQRAPEMTAPDWAIEGSVERLDAWDSATIPDGAVVICRNNAPLMATAMRLIAAGRGINVHGRDIGKSLVTLMEKLGGKSNNLIQPMFMAEIEHWRERELTKAQESRKGPINDRADCLIVFARSSKDKEGAVAYAKHLFAQEGPVNLMTGHKSKGLEFKDVFYLDSHLIPSRYAARMAAEGDETHLQQERNLNYVIITRSQENLTFISSDCYEAT